VLLPGGVLVHKTLCERGGPANNSSRIRLWFVRLAFQKLIPWQNFHLEWPGLASNCELCNLKWTAQECTSGGAVVLPRPGWCRGPRPLHSCTGEHPAASCSRSMHDDMTATMKPGSIPSYSILRITIWSCVCLCVSAGKIRPCNPSSSPCWQAMQHLALSFVR